MIKGKDYETCDHCNMDVSPGEIDKLPKALFPLLTSPDEFKICEYCYGAIECEDDEIGYWTEWIKKKRAQ